jgi:DNA polymerase IV
MVIVSNLFLLSPVLIMYTVFVYSYLCFCGSFSNGVVSGVDSIINSMVDSLPNMRKIIHCDADCFFAAIEMRDDPSLRGIPMAVGGDPSRRGVISTCNYEARVFGVHSALASAYAKKLCPQLVIIPHNMAKYRLAAQQLKEIFDDYTELVEPLSLDEAFLDVSFAKGYCGSATLIAKDIRRRVEREIGITVSAGISSNKFVAKVASDWDKPNGLTVVEPSKIKGFLHQLPVSCIPGVGKKMQATLQNLDIHQCADILPIDKLELIRQFGQFGYRLYHFARGEDGRVVSPIRERKTVSVEQTLDQDILPNESEKVLTVIYQKLQNRINALSIDKPFAKMFVKIKFGDFSKTTVEITITKLDFESCKKLFYQGWERQKKPIRLLGIGVKLQPNMGTEDGDRQLNLFTTV